MEYTMRPRIKICGITNIVDALAAVHHGADALGFIFYEKSPRYVPPDRARTVIDTLPPSVMRVGVFVNTPRATINTIAEATKLHAVQLSGDESPEDCRGYAIPVIKAIRPRSMDDLSQLDRYSAAAFLVDGHKEGTYGGTGTHVDPAIAREAARRYPIFLAGGISPRNVVSVVRDVRPFALDVNSGVESSPGKKDHSQLAHLFRALSELDAA